MAKATVKAGKAARDAASSALAAAAARRGVRASQAPAVELSAADRENPDKLTGEPLRALAHRRGVARSESENMPDDKLRMQLRYITNRQYADESA